MLAAARTPRRHLQTLVLNADFRPLSTWPLSTMSPEDAIKAVYLEKVSIIEEWDDAFHSPSTTIRVPRVVALREYEHVHAQPKFCRRSVLLRDRWCCQYCGGRFPSEELTFDHVIPRAAGGKTEWTNILMACVACNARKKDTLPNYSGGRGKSAGGMRPLKEPRQPSSGDLMRAGLEFLDAGLREDFGSWLYWDAPLKA